jgi:hypothetical protein
MKMSKKTTGISLVCIVMILVLGTVSVLAIAVKAGASASKKGVKASVSVRGNKPGDPFTWPVYSPNLNYNLKDEYPDLKPPTKVLDDVTGVMGTVTSGWWCFRYGSNKNAKVTAAAWKPMLERFNKDFAYIRNVMGWPPDKRTKNGYFSTIYLFGSDLSTDNASNTDLGGWMGSVHYKGEHWPMVILSYYPVYSYDPSCPYEDREAQMGACIHEGIHAILAEMPGCRKAAWFHEGGNTWLQSTMESNKSGDYSSMGWLSAGAMLAPFMPIECYSGWLQDGSFGGPAAEGVNRYEKGRQLCTWRTLLGGTQYGESFAHFMGEIVSKGSIAWIWQNCTERVLEGIATKEGGLGDKQTRRLVAEFRGRQAMCDFGKWSPAYKNLLESKWGITVKAEYPPVWIECQPWTATCYVATSYDKRTRTLTPEKRTLPGWTGANQIPLKVTGKETLSVDFKPIGENMVCQLVYRATDGSVVYSKPVSRGTCSLRLEKPVKNNVVVAVICNTDYVFKGDETRKKKYDYRLKLGKGITGTADIYTKWWE